MFVFSNQCHVCTCELGKHLHAWCKPCLDKSHKWKDLFCSGKIKDVKKIIIILEEKYWENGKELAMLD